MEEKVLFKVGDHVVYPPHGVAMIKRIDTREVGGQQASFYVLHILENKMTVMVPVDNPESVNMRPVVTGDTIDSVFGVLKDHDVKIETTTWNRRYREYREKINTGSVYEIAEVLRNLFLLRHSKDLSHGERNMLNEARDLLVQEFSVAKDSPEKSIRDEIEAIFN